MSPIDIVAMAKKYRNLSPKRWIKQPSSLQS